MIRIKSMPALAAALALLCTGCAFKRVTFDNKTTSETLNIAHVYKLNRANNGRDVKVTANFQSLDSMSQWLADKGVITSRGQLEMMQAGMDIIDGETSQTQLRANLGYLTNLDRRYKAMVGAGLLVSSTHSQGMVVLDFIQLPNNVKTNDLKSTAPLDLDGLYQDQLKRAQEKILKDYPEYGTTLGELYAAVRATPAYAEFKSALAAPKNQADRTERDKKVRATAKALGEATEQIVLENQTRLKAESQKVAQSHAELKTKIEKSDAKLQDLYRELAAKGLNVEEIKEFLDKLQRRDLAPQAAAAAAEPPQAAALKAARDQIKRKKNKAEEDMAALGALDLAPITKFLAESGQKKVIEDLQGEYEEANQEYLAVLRQTTAATNYEGPGERAVIYSFSLLEAPDQIQRYPNGMIESVGGQPQARGLGRAFVDGLWRTVRVISTPAAFVASVFFLR